MPCVIALRFGTMTWVWQLACTSASHNWATKFSRILSHLCERKQHIQQQQWPARMMRKVWMYLSRICSQVSILLAPTRCTPSMWWRLRGIHSSVTTGIAKNQPNSASYVSNGEALRFAVSLILFNYVNIGWCEERSFSIFGVNTEFLHFYSCISARFSLAGVFALNRFCTSLVSFKEIEEEGFIFWYTDAHLLRKQTSLYVDRQSYERSMSGCS